MMSQTEDKELDGILQILIVGKNFVSYTPSGQKIAVEGKTNLLAWRNKALREVLVGLLQHLEKGMHHPPENLVGIEHNLMLDKFRIAIEVELERLGVK